MSTKRSSLSWEEPKLLEPTGPEHSASRPSSPPQVIELQEHVPQRISAEAFTNELGEKLWRDYGKQVTVEFPSVKTAGKYQLTAQGYAGYIPLADNLHLRLEPKVPVANLFRMWEYAYGMKMKLLPGLYACGTIEEFYESLAIYLSRNVLHRVQQGLYRCYIPTTKLLPHVRGRLDRRAFIPCPGDPRLLCHYRAQTADLEENRILAWTLFSIARCPLSLERCQPIVRQAYHALEDMVTLHPYSAADCIGRRYDRLNADYAVLHALCRFFLEGIGPSHDKGVHLMVPFLVDMERLFELFVAQWLRRHLPPHIKLQEQQRVPLSGNGNLSFNIDLVLSDRASSRVLTVLDTKYKRSSQPSAEDVAQVVAYAQAQGCQEAVLVYPVPVHSVPVYPLPGTTSDNAAFQRNAASAPTAGASQPITARVGNIRVRSLTFSLDADLERAGHSFIENLLA